MPSAPALTGSLRILFVYDVCEEIRMDELQKRIGAQRYGDYRAARPSSPEYVRFERPPVVQSLGPLVFQNGGGFSGEVNYYEYGAVSLKLGLPFAVDWPDLVALSSKWIADPHLEAEARQVIQKCLAQARPALIRPNSDWLTEDYFIIHVHNHTEPDGSHSLNGAQLIAQQGDNISRIVRGEVAELSQEEQHEVLRSRTSYFPDDLLVVGWNAAFLCDSEDGAAQTIQLLEYANTQLLAFRYYDTILSPLLERVYSSLDRRSGLVSRWRLAREAQNLSKIRLDVRELAERIDTSIKFVSDMYSARQYRMAAAKIGVEDYRRLVESKLHTAGDLYTFMMDQFHAGRAFVLEFMVVVILVIELFFVFRNEL
jgi:hypothetical protein